jgi:hypothetical protein
MIDKTVAPFGLAIQLLKKTYLISMLFVVIIRFTTCYKVALSEYKEIAKATLEAYAESKGEENYYDDNWRYIRFIVSDGKVEIDAAKSISAVDEIVSKAIDTIDQEYAIEIPLSDELRLHILDVYCTWATSQFGDNYPKYDYFYYYGEYSGIHVIKFAGWCFSYITEDIDGLDFSRPCVSEIYAVSEDVGGTLKEIYEAGYLTRTELEAIHEVHSAIFH